MLIAGACLEWGGQLIHNGTRDNCEIGVYKCTGCGTRLLSVVDIDFDYENGFMHKIGDKPDLDIAAKLCLHKADDD